ncbi:MAG: hypothetical protein GX629_07425 [Phycisphaerae bacterium]|jgi:hypothetical protein|nr:hypothetical protein [Phycisphaerae bacterium]
MSIRFFCEKCNKALEVDDSDANGKVICFYCKEAVSVPSESTAELVKEGEVRAVNLPKRSALWGVVGLICGLLVAGIIGGMIVWVISTTALPMSRDPEFAKLSQTDQQAKMKAAIKTFSEERPVIQKAPMVLLGLSTLGVIFSVIGLVKNSGRKGAIVGIIICGAYVGLALAGMLRS